jgi:hypothetical protein
MAHQTNVQKEFSRQAEPIREVPFDHQWILIVAQN